MHLILLIAFIVCVVHYGLLRGTEHFVLGIIKVIALIGMIILGLVFLGLLMFSHHAL
jgi:L-asparagine transporter-like permease